MNSRTGEIESTRTLFLIPVGWVLTIRHQTTAKGQKYSRKSEYLFNFNISLMKYINKHTDNIRFKIEMTL